MKLHRPLDDVLSGTATLRTLRALVGNETRSLTGREIAHAAGLSSSQALTSLVRLEEQGIVHRKVVGRAHLWTVDRSHILYDALRELLLKEGELLGRLEEDIRTALRHEPVDRAVLFGSILSGRERASSDIDLWVEVPGEAARRRVDEKLYLLRSRIADRYGNPLAPIVHTREEVRALGRSSLVEEVQLHGRILIGRGRP